MDYLVTVVPNAKHEKVIKISENELKVYLTKPPIDGKANNALEKILKKYFKKSITIIKGQKGRKKKITIVN